MKMLLLTATCLAGVSFFGDSEIAEASHRNCDYGYSLSGTTSFGNPYGSLYSVPSRTSTLYYGQSNYYASPYSSFYSRPYYERYGDRFSRPGVSIYFGSGYSRYGGYSPYYGSGFGFGFGRSFGYGSSFGHHGSHHGHHGHHGGHRGHGGHH